MNHTRWRLIVLLAFVLVPALVSPGCVRPAEERAERDKAVGDVDIGDTHIEVDGGLAAVQRTDDGELDLWAQAPVFDLRFDSGDDAPGEWEITVQNAMPDADITALDADDDRIEVLDRRQPDDTTVTWRVAVPPSETTRLRVAPPDADEAESYEFAVLSDVQDEVSDVDDFWEDMNANESLRFVVSTGDLTQFGSLRELANFRESLDELHIPFYTTMGNHELGEAADRGFHELFGRVNFQFEFKQTYFTFLDSASSTIDPLAYDWLDDWVERADDDVHVFLTHIPPLDPVGIRNGAFRSRNEAQKLLNMLTKGGADLGLYGHIHSYYAETNGDIPIYISGGGGALPERFDGIGRHYLTVEAAPNDEIRQVGLVRIGDE